MVASLRKSSRTTRNSCNTKNLTESVDAQSRITEFVNVRKRATSSAVEQVKKSTVLEVPTETESLISTPVKIKRKQVKREIKTVRKMGVLTPSPSSESIGDEPEVVNVTIEPDVSVTEPKTTIAEALVTETIVTETLEPKPSAVPAYKRFAHLVEGVRSQKVKLSEPEELELITSVTETKLATNSGFVWNDFKSVPWLPLNDKWSFYEKLIFNVDSLCVLAAGRSQPCVFHKIQKTLENVLGKQVPLEQMERLKTVWPDAYEYRESRVVMQGRRVDSVAFSVPGIAGTDSSAALLNERKEKVRGRVQKYLIEAHAREFGYPLNETPKQWNEKFDQSKVTEISRSPLLEQATNVNINTDTPQFIKEIITSSPMKINVNSIVNITTNTEDSIPQSPVKQLSLLERIRAKEQALQNKKCTGSGDSDERVKAILSQMDRFTQSVMFTFTSAKKTSLFLTDLTAKLVQSANVPLSGTEVLERLKMLEKCAPEWIKICDDSGMSSSSPKYVKILDKARSLNSILESVHSQYKQ